MLGELISYLWATGACLVFLGAGGLAAAGAAQRLLPGESLAGRIAGLVILWHLMLVIPALPLLQTGLFSAQAAAGVFAGIVAAILCWSFGAVPDFFRDVASALDSVDISGLAWWQRAIAGLAVGTIVCTILRAFILSPVTWDGLIYHLWLPAEWVRNDGLFLFQAPDNWDTCQFFPLNWEIIAAWLFRFAGDDRFINLINYPFLIQIFCSCFALCRLFGSSRYHAMLGSSALCFNAAVFTYVNTAYVENAMTAHLLSGYYFLLRALTMRNRSMAGMAAAGFGLAVGTKIVALPHLAIASLPFLYMLISSKHRLDRPLATGMLLVSIIVAVSGFWYIRAWIYTGSPIYPNGMAVAGISLFPDSAKHAAYNEFFLKQAPQGIRQSFLSVLTMLRVLAPHPITCGPILFLILPLVPYGLRRMAAREGWMPVLLLITGGLVTLAGYFSPKMLPVRFFWTESSSRFLLLPLSFMIIAATAALSDEKRPSVGGWIIWGGLALSLAYQIPGSWDLGEITMNRAMYAVLFVSAVSGIVFKTAWLRRVLTRSNLQAISVALLCWFCIAPMIHSSMRFHSFRNAYELHPLSRDQVPAWEFCDRPEQPLRISLSIGFDGRGGNNWFMYPLLGRKLQNTVYYSATTSSGKIVDSFVHSPEAVLSQGCRDAWLARLKESSTDYLVLMEPFPPETEWADQVPEVLMPVLTGKKVKIYKLISSS